MATQNNIVKRSAGGRFAPGTAPGPGRPKRDVERRYLQAISERIDLETWGKIIDRAKADALAGDARAREWLAGLLIGRSDGSVEVRLQAIERAEARAEEAEAQAEHDKKARAAWNRIELEMLGE